MSSHGHHHHTRIIDRGPVTHVTNMVAPIQDITANTGNALPDATTTTFKYFLLTGQTPTTLNGDYQLVGNSHWVQVNNQQ